MFLHNHSNCSHSMSHCKTHLSTRPGFLQLLLLPFPFMVTVVCAVIWARTGRRISKMENNHKFYITPVNTNICGKKEVAINTIYHYLFPQYYKDSITKHSRTFLSQILFKLDNLKGEDKKGVLQSKAGTT